MMRCWLGIAILGSYLAAAGQDDKLATLAGRVVNSVTGEPVRKVRLTLNGQGHEPVSTGAVTDADGRFVFDRVQPGMYSLAAAKPGYLPQMYGSRGPMSGASPLVLAAGQERKDIEFKLLPQCVITGKVVDDDGDPIANRVSVLAVRAGRSSTGRPMVTSSDTTNDLGEFRIAELSPGRYLVSVRPDGRMGAVEGRRSSNEPEEVFVATFYPGVTDPSTATVIDLRPGQEASGIQIPLRKAKVYRVEGRLAGVTGAQSLRNMQVAITARDSKELVPMFGGFGQMKPDGSFVIEQVQPGSYTLSVIGRGEGRMQVVGRTSVDVSDSNLKGLVVTLLEPLQIAGTVRAEGDPKAALDAVHIVLSGTEGGPFGSQQLTVSQDGTFKADGVAPDKYYFWAFGISETTYVKSVRVGKQDVLETGLDLTQAQGTVHLEIVLGNKPGAIEGTVQQDGQPQQSVTVLLSPDPLRPARLRQMVKAAITDQSGRYALKGVAPGNYKLYALPGGSEMDLLGDPEALKPYEDKGVKVTVEEGATARAELAPIPADTSQGQ